jgi:4-diphosphocytidyl-2-C-methyl-D-erythritol kinase
MKILAPAKINLFLEVTGRRPDGYHTLASVMQTVSLYDEITIVPHPSRLSLKCNRPDLPVDERNLALKAALRLKEALGVEAGATITLKKNIPLGAGLGGGSSDAAAVLKGLLKLWKKRIPREKLVKIAAGLGADVPFFLQGGAAVARGIGEKLEPIKGVPRAWFILVYPGFPVSTAWVYQNLCFPLTRKQKITTMKHLLQLNSPPDSWGRRMFNRLEDVVLPKYSDIRRIKETLEGLGCPSLMSGSGSTVFCMVPSLHEGERMRMKLKRGYGDVWLVQSVP